jgi:hypothetical protein
MGTSIAIIDRTYGHLVCESEKSARAWLDARFECSGGKKVLASPG